jgi:pectinesterase
LIRFLNAHDLVIENTAGSGFTINKAVALPLYGDDIKLFNCKLLGHQDTFFGGPLPVD